VLSPRKSPPADHQPTNAFEALVLWRLQSLEDGQRATWKLGLGVGGTIIMLLISCLGYMIANVYPVPHPEKRTTPAVETVAYAARK
jgi:hypothetical protein